MWTNQNSRNHWYQIVRLLTTTVFCELHKIFYWQLYPLSINPFHATDILWYPLKISGNQWLADDFRGYQIRSVAWNGLIKNYVNSWQTKLTNTKGTILIFSVWFVKNNALWLLFTLIPHELYSTVRLFKWCFQSRLTNFAWHINVQKQLLNVLYNSYSEKFHKIHRK